MPPMQISCCGAFKSVTHVPIPTSKFQPMSLEQITLTVPRGTRAWINKLKKTGITPEQVFRIGIARVGEQIAEHAAKNSESQATNTEETNTEEKNK
jgi:hypothetical protein